MKGIVFLSKYTEYEFKSMMINVRYIIYKNGECNYNKSYTINKILTNKTIFRTTFFIICMKHT